MSNAETRPVDKKVDACGICGERELRWYAAVVGGLVQWCPTCGAFFGLGPLEWRKPEWPGVTEARAALAERDAARAEAAANLRRALAAEALALRATEHVDNAGRDDTFGPLAEATSSWRAGPTPHGGPPPVVGSATALAAYLVARGLPFETDHGPRGIEGATEPIAVRCRGACRRCQGEARARGPCVLPVRHEGGVCLCAEHRRTENACGAVFQRLADGASVVCDLPYGHTCPDGTPSGHAEALDGGAPTSVHPSSKGATT